MGATVEEMQLGLLAGLPEHPQQFAVERHLVDTAREGIGGIEHLVRPGRDADRPRRARTLGAALSLTGLETGLGAERSGEPER
jgi:hypothetical protein